ncbi:sodium/hydrogen exchanger 1 isoform X3 [Populus alba x Populus x berolinensis]|nr:sodium/hydrogen exchanger 1 isoform X3 [Populus alba x Populus x berolinensis]
MVFVVLDLNGNNAIFQVGLLSAFIIKTLYFGRHSTDREFALMILMAYLSYLLAELLNLSGILTVFFCGIVMSHYTWHNVTESSRITTKHAFATMSFIAETFIFLYVGMDALDIDKWRESKASAGTSAAVSSTLFALVLVGRAAFVFPIANILNCVQKRESSKIHFKQQFIMWWAGLMRGAVTIALSYNQFASYMRESPESALMITSTIIVVLFSTIVCGSVTKPLIEAVLLRHRKPMVSDFTDNLSLEDLSVLLLESADPNNSNNNQPAGRASSFRLLISHPTTTVHYFWRKFDDRFMRPMFGGPGLVPFVPSTPTGAADESSSA